LEAEITSKPSSTKRPVKEWIIVGSSSTTRIDGNIKLSLIEFKLNNLASLS
jgi:hypothetical protein